MDKVLRKKAKPLSPARMVSYGGLVIAMGILLPFLLHMIGGDALGSSLLPMHIPVLLGGFFLGPAAGLFVGGVTPVLSFLIRPMPALPRLPFMVVELAAYCFFTGLFYQKLKWPVFPSLVLSMAAGRVANFLAYLAALYLFGQNLPGKFAASAWLSLVDTIGRGLPGIVLQLICIPLLLFALKKGGLLHEP